ncbi:MAG: hypothetical protein NVSMB2_25500 [Chloroflexota bacterium]
MALADVDTQTLIIRRVGDIDPITGDPLEYGVTSIAGVIGSSMTLLWSAHADKAQIAPRLRELYVERDAFDLVIAQLGALVDVTIEGETQHLSQRVDRLAKRRYQIEQEITALQKLALARRSGVLGPITTTAPESPPVLQPIYPWGPDANDGAYSGSPYRVRRTQRY